MSAPAEAAGPPPAEVERVPHVIRVKRGVQPTPSTLTPFQRWAWRTFRAQVTKRGPVDPALDENLVKAHMRIRGDEYLAFVYAATLFAAIGLAVAGVVIYLLFASAGIALLGVVAGVALPIVLTVAAFFVLKGLPGSKAKERATKIDAKISPAMSFVSAMASADVNVDQIFEELAKQTIYGEVAEEAAWITRDTEILGVDILTALRNGASRSPSKRWQDFLQGVVTTATSGGQLKPYFLLKAEQFEQEHKLELLRRVETMGLMAETFVTAVVAFPLFLVIIIAIFAVIGGGSSFLVLMLFIIVGPVIALSQMAFGVFMYQLAQEA